MSGTEQRLSVGAAAEIKSKLDLVDFIGESVPLKKAGTIFKGLCPFHGEKTPSFTVTPARERWHCFGCQKGGDIFNFVMERESVDFPEALRRLAQRAGVEIDERTTREDARRKRLREVLDLAISFYHQVLTNSRTGEPALAYLKGRGFTDKTLLDHQIGFAPEAWDTLARKLTEKRGIREEELVAAGLARERQGRRGVYDYFRGRIIFPIRDASGGATGIGGRILGAEVMDANGREKGPKYLNTPATLLFDKSRTLYLIDRAKGAIRRSGRAVLVEGNTDALMAHQQGFDNVIGSLGTALTAGQVELVTRYAPELALAYDVDSAGQSAATFGATELTSLVGEIERSPHRGRLTDVGVVRLPDGRDPDEIIRDEPEVWRAASEQPQPIIEYLIDRFANRHDPRTIPGRERLVNAVMPTLRTVTDPVRRDGYLQLLARRSGVEQRVLLETLRGPEPVFGSRRPNASNDGRAGGRINLDAILASPGALDPQVVERTLEPVETALLQLLLLHPEEQPRVCELLAPEQLLTTPARELWRRILDDRAGDATGAFKRDRFLEGLDPTLQALARALYARTAPGASDPDDVHQAIEQCLLRLERRHLDERFDFQRAELAEAEAADDDEARDRIQRRIRDLQVDRAELDRRIADSSLLNRHRNRPTDPTRIASPAGGSR